MDGQIDSRSSPSTVFFAGIHTVGVYHNSVSLHVLNVVQDVFIIRIMATVFIFQAFIVPLT